VRRERFKDLRWARIQACHWGEARNRVEGTVRPELRAGALCVVTEVEEVRFECDMDLAAFARFPGSFCPTGETEGRETETGRQQSLRTDVQISGMFLRFERYL